MDTAALPDLLRYQDLASHGVTRHRFDQLLEAGEYERIAPGVFLRARTTDDTTAGWLAIAAKRPEATICLRSALVIYELTDEIPFQSEIAIPRGTQPVTLGKFHTHVGWHRFDPETFQIGRTEFVLPGGMSIGLYSAERTIVDLFRLSHQWGSDYAIAALKRWLQERGNYAGKLLTVAQHFPKTLPAIRQTLEILLI